MQIAGIYALISDKLGRDAQLTSEQARTKALRWLGRALRDDPALAKTASKDPDLAKRRDDANFRRLIGSAMTLNSSIQ